MHVVPYSGGQGFTLDDLFVGCFVVFSGFSVFWFFVSLRGAWRKYAESVEE